MRAKQRGVVIDAGFAGHVHTDFAIFKKAIAAGAIPDIISTDLTRLSSYTRGGKNYDKARRWRQDNQLLVRGRT